MITAVLLVAAFAVAIAAAVRSTWSPCGLSMLSTITPFGERAKSHRYAATATWFVAGAVLGGLTMGVCAAVLAAVTSTIVPSGAVAGLCALGATLIALGSDTGVAGVRLPVHHRQVNERWLDAYRPWVYGAGFGWQIGTGLATYVTTAAVYLLVVLSALAGQPAAALAVGGVFGLVRGLAVTLTRGVSSPAALLEFHRRFALAAPRADRLVRMTMAGTFLALVVTTWSPWSVAVPVGIAAAALAIGAATGRFGRAGRNRAGVGGVPADRSVAPG
jgi:hypothetical protein